MLGLVGALAIYSFACARPSNMHHVGGGVCVCACMYMFVNPYMCEGDVLPFNTLKCMYVCMRVYQ